MHVKKELLGGEKAILLTSLSAAFINVFSLVTVAYFAKF